jgi:hypothetical protein
MLPPKAGAAGFALVLGVAAGAATAGAQTTEPPAPTTSSTAVVVPSPAPAPDRTAPTTPAATPEKPVKLRWRDTWLIWDNAVTAQTLGIGKNYQSPNPTYEMTGSLRPRYYLYDGKDDAFFAAGRIDLVREFTNSDVTTERGETTFSDATLLTGYRRKLAASPGYETIVTASLPILTFPTSKFSLDNGTILGLGTEARLTQSMPLAGSNWTVFKTLTVGAVAGYNHTFTRAVVPTDEELRRVRLNPEGRTVPGDQLVGAAFPEHELHFNARLIADITEKLSLFVEASYRPTWKYSFPDVAVCVQTGACSKALNPTAPTTYVPVTSFEADVYYDILDELSVALGYVNVETQPGLDGQRRSIFYSPGSQFFLSVIGHLDAIYLAAAGKKPEASGSGSHLHP